VAGLAELRGMFALGVVDTESRTLTLARDPLGVKPLYYTSAVRGGGGGEVVFASEPAAILAHPRVSVEPDMPALSAYLTTIRTTLDDRTLFRGIRAVRPGEALVFALGDASGRRGSSEPTRIALHPELTAAEAAITAAPFEAAARVVRDVVADSVLRHLRADVPTCALLSGGLDSTIIAAEVVGRARAAGRGVRTYSAGCPETPPASGESESDLWWARWAAARLGTLHVEAPVARELFVARWAEMVSRQGVPLSTPNEVAINEVARTLREEGHVVALSGEGADELFGGYDVALAAAAAFEAEAAASPHTIESLVAARARFQLESASWIASGLKSRMLLEGAWAAAEQDALLARAYEEGMRACTGASEGRDGASGASTGGADPLDAHLRFQQRVNLTGLLQRLDTATMLESVEGRVPFADRVVAAAALALPMAYKFGGGEAGFASGCIGAASGGTGTGSGAAAPAASPARIGKRILRAAFADRVPAEIVARPKASFPLPFQGWLAAHASRLRASGFARALFTPGAIERVSSDPARHWRHAWPMINAAMWGERWWGAGAGQVFQADSSFASPDTSSVPPR
jgi:asparagine synthase (glutamine-hydrolysing)